MLLNNDIISLITRTLSLHLNKPVNEGFTDTLVKFYLKNNSISAFLIYTKALGFPSENDESVGKEIYKLINDNISTIECLMKEKEEKGNAKIPKRPNNSLEKKKNDRSSKKPKFALSFDDNEELEEELNNLNPSSEVNLRKTNFKKIRSKNLPLYNDIKHDFSIDDSLDSNQEHETKAKEGPKFKFKKIKKEDALRIKEDETHLPIMPMPKSEESNQKTDISANTKHKNATLSLSELAELEKQQQTELQKETRSFDEFSDNDNDLENDREWYTIDELDHNDLHDDFEDEVFTETTKQISSLKRPKEFNIPEGTGGGFDDITGEYYDYDHNQDQSQDLSRIPITSHYFIPPFLEDSKEYLSLQIGHDRNDSKIRGIGPTISPIKDPDSELASMAKQGSMVVKERKSKNERSKQAKERSTLSGTALGNVLGVETHDKANGSNEKLHENKFSNENEIETQDEKAIIQQQRRSLPAFAVKKNLLKTIAENQVTVVIGETGSGKTTQLTQYLYEEGFGSNLEQLGKNRMIGCTQPRRVAAMSVAKRVSEEMNCKLGDEVGFAIRFEDKTNPRKTVIKYMTEGVLLREILVDPNLDKYSCIIMDEAHERSLNTDVLLGLFKMLLTRRKDLKLIVTSATLNADRFTRYFGNAPQFTIPGRTFPVDVLFSKSGCTDYVETAVKQVLTIHLQNSAKSNNNDGDILVFMTGQEDIEVTCELLQEKLDLLDNPPPLDIFPIFSTMPADLQKKIFNKTNLERRKVVVATNIAETSLTVDGVKYVIDTGLVKSKVYNPKLGMDMLQVIPISIANAQQRSGRAGRTGPGVAYRLYTERSAEEQMYLQPIPEIQRTNLSNVMLQLKSLKIEDVPNFPFLDPPPKDLLSCSLYDLWGIGAIDNCGELTQLGQSMSRFPMEPALSKLILLSCNSEFHCSEEIIIIVAMLSVPSVFYRPKERANEADAIREKFSISESDHLTLLNVYNQWKSHSEKPQMNMKRLTNWCSRNFFHSKSLLRARDIKNQLLLIMEKNRLKLLKSRSDEDIRKCLCAAFYQQLAKIMKINIGNTGNSEYIHLRHNYMKMFLHPTSALNGGTSMAPTYVVYHELILTNREYMSCVTSVDPLWLLEFGYIFFEVSAKVQARLCGHIDFNLMDPTQLERSLEEDRIKYQAKLQEKKLKRQRNNNSNLITKSKFNKRRAF